jgi:hypothetical protein
MLDAQKVVRSSFFVLSQEFEDKYGPAWPNLVIPAIPIGTQNTAPASLKLHGNSVLCFGGGGV